jgi:hypothetical protein
MPVSHFKYWDSLSFNEVFYIQQTDILPNVNCQQTGVAHASGINNLKPENILSDGCILLDVSQNYVHYQDMCFILLRA